MFRHAAHSQAVEHQLEALAAVDEALICLRCGKHRRADGCLCHARRELRTANQLLETTKAA